MIIAKFGGTSMADASQFRKVRNIVRSHPERRIIVVSAPGKRFAEDNKITDLLYTLYMHLQYGVPYEELRERILDRYTSIERDLGLSGDVGKELSELLGRLDKSFDQNELISRGEYFSARLMSEYLGYTFLDAKDLIRFSYDGKVDTEETEKRIRELCRLEGSYVIPGFYGSFSNGEICLFSRGGSDITGAYLTSSLGASVYENWTDVPGVLTADPRVVDRPKTVERLTYAELHELSYMGANVLHDDSVAPVENKNVCINIRNTNDPDNPGTMILDECEGGTVITGIAGSEDFVSFDIAKVHMSSETGFARKVLEIFENFRVNVDHLPTGVDTLSVIVSGDSVAKCMYEIVSRIEKQFGAEVSVRKNIALIAVVGRNMAGKSGVSARIFETLATGKINVKMITQSPDERNIILGLENSDFKPAIRRLYETFSVCGWI